jgi:hypothetical protein
MPAGALDILFSITSRTALGPTQLPIHLVLGALSVLRLKNEWSSTSIPPVYLHGMDKETFSSGSFW